MLEQFFGRADDELVGAVLDFVGRTLRNTSGDLSAPIRSRLEELFEWRLEVVESAPDDHRAEARAFGTWFLSGKFEEAWALETLRKTIDLAGAPTFGDAVIHRLVDVAHHQPAAADAVVVMLEGAENEWDNIAWREPVERLLSVARESGVEEAEEGIRRIVYHYVTRGRNEFRTHAPRL